MAQNGTKGNTHFGVMMKQPMLGKDQTRKKKRETLSEFVFKSFFLKCFNCGFQPCILSQSFISIPCHETRICFPGGVSGSSLIQWTWSTWSTCPLPFGFFSLEEVNMGHVQFFIYLGPVLILEQPYTAQH